MTPTPRRMEEACAAPSLLHLPIVIDPPPVYGIGQVHGRSYPPDQSPEELSCCPPLISLAGIACIIMREVYATIRESIYPNPSFLSGDFPAASGRLL